MFNRSLFVVFFILLGMGSIYADLPDPKPIFNPENELLRFSQLPTANLKNIDTIIRFVIKKKKPPSMKIRKMFFSYFQIDDPFPEQKIALIKNALIGKEITLLLLLYLDVLKNIEKKEMMKLEKSNARRDYEMYLLSIGVMNETSLLQYKNVHRTILERHREKSAETENVLRILVDNLSISQKNLDVLFSVPE